MSQKQYKAIFFDWDGTAVISRKAPVDDAVAVMKPLLAKDIKLVVVSGTTYENIAGGRLHEYFTPEELTHLWLGLGRGAYNYRYHEDGSPYISLEKRRCWPFMIRPTRFTVYCLSNTAIPPMWCSAAPITARSI